MLILKNFSTRGLLLTLESHSKFSKKAKSAYQILKDRNIDNFEDLENLLNSSSYLSSNNNGVKYLRAIVGWAKKRLDKVNEFGVKDTLFCCYFKMLERSIGNLSSDILEQTDKANKGDVLLCPGFAPFSQTKMGEYLGKMTIFEIKKLFSTLDPITLQCEFLSVRGFGIKTGMQVIGALEKYHHQLLRQQEENENLVAVGNLFTYRFNEKLQAMEAKISDIITGLIEMSQATVWGTLSKSCRSKLAKVAKKSIASDGSTPVLVKNLVCYTTFSEATGIEEPLVMTQVLKRFSK